MICIRIILTRHCLFHENTPALTFRKQHFEKGPLAGKHGLREVLEQQVFVLVQEAHHIVRHLRESVEGTCKGGCKAGACQNVCVTGVQYCILSHVHYIISSIP